MPTTAIIGAGVSGLAAAIRMCRAGHEVLVFERSETFGGKMGELLIKGFRFDTGPSLFTWPSLLEELLPQQSQEQEGTWKPLDIITKYFWDNGTTLEAPADPHSLALALEQTFGEPAAVTLNYLLECARLFSLTKPVFLERYPASPSNIFSYTTLKSLPGLPRLKVWQSLNDYNRRVFNHKAIVQLFNRYATYNGSNPYTAPATLRVIAHLEHNDGAYFPQGGMYSLAKRLFQTAVDLGAHFHFKQEVTALQIDQKRITSLTAAGIEYPVDHVISAIDIHQVYQNLLPGSKKDLFHGLKSLSSSALIFFWGMNQSFPELGLHNVFFSNDYESEFDHIFHLGKMSGDLTIYVYISSKMNPDDAPEGCENWFVMVNAPPGADLDWDAVISETRKRILQRLTHVLGKEIENFIITETVRDPRGLEKHTGAFHGAIYGRHSNGIFSAFQRHPNAVKAIKNLAFAGGTVHPGGGIPLCLLSARLAVDHTLRS